jgi:pentatricopeptide repeat protein
MRPWAWPLLLAFEEDELLRDLLFGKKRELEEGRAYLVKEKKPEKALAMFHQSIDSGWRPLYVTRQHPNHIVRRRGEKDIRVVWLSTTLGKDYIDPHNLNSLSNLIGTFLDEGPRGLILLDGIEYLMINNDFARILHFLEYVNEQIALRRAALLLSVDERAFEAKELAYIERNTVPID